MTTNYYEVLGVDPDATPNAIKSAFRKRAKSTHPDALPGSDTDAEFKLLVEAKQCLSDPARRQEYDSYLAQPNRMGFQEYTRESRVSTWKLMDVIPMGRERDTGHPVWRLQDANGQVKWARLEPTRGGLRFNGFVSGPVDIIRPPRVPWPVLAGIGVIGGFVFAGPVGGVIGGGLSVLLHRKLKSGC